MSTGTTRAAVKVFFDEHMTPTLLAHGYARSGRTYRLASDLGDTAVVDFQVSSGTHRDEYQFYVNLAIAPVPWVHYLRSGTPRSASEPVEESEGLLRARVDPPGRFNWVLTPSVELAHDTGQRVAAALVPRLGELAELLERDILTERLRTGEHLSGWRCDRVAGLIALLTEQGPSAELEELLLGVQPGVTKFLNWAWASVAAAAEQGRSAPSSPS